jgi:hypothetical protein
MRLDAAPCGKPNRRWSRLFSLLFSCHTAVAPGFLGIMVTTKRSVTMKHVFGPRVSALAAALIVLSAQAAMAASRRYSSTTSSSGSTWIVIVGVIVFVGGLMGVILYFDRRRSQKIEAIAKSFGLTFRRKPTEADKALPFGSYLANEGHGRIVSNVLEAARSDELNFTIFDYQYTIGYGKSSSTYQQTITRMQSSVFQLPSFILYPERFSRKWARRSAAPISTFPSPPNSAANSFFGATTKRRSVLFSLPHCARPSSPTSASLSKERAIFFSFFAPPAAPNRTSFPARSNRTNALPLSFSEHSARRLPAVCVVRL